MPQVIVDFGNSVMDIPAPKAMLKFVVVLYRKPEMSREQFRAYLQDVHGPMADRIPGVCAYVQNHAVTDSTRSDPGWDAIVELWWESRNAMEEAWRSPEGQIATADLEAFADLSRTRWSIVDEQRRR